MTKKRGRKMTQTEYDYYYRLRAVGAKLIEESRLRAVQLAGVMQKDIGCTICMEDEKFTYRISMVKKDLKRRG